MKATLIVLTGGHLLHLKHCLSAVALLSPQASEIIVTVDPTPGVSISAVEKLVASVASAHGTAKNRKNATPMPVPKVVAEGEPSEAFRPGTARNNGARHATGDRLIFLDGDCIPDPDFVAAHMAADGVGFGFRRMLDEPTEAQLKAGLTEEILATATMEKRLLAAQFTQPVPPWIVFGFSMSLSRETFAAIGGFDESLDGTWGGSEDLDLAERASRTGQKPVALIQGGHVTHIGHPQRPIREDAEAVRQLIISGDRPLVANPERPFVYHSDTPEPPVEETPSDGTPES